MYYWDLGGIDLQEFADSVSVVVRRMYYWDLARLCIRSLRMVSVVVRRMYYWDFKRNRLKTKDFDRLNSELFFENARSARKVALFSKNWGYCLTI